MQIKVLGIPYKVEEVENIPNTVDTIGLFLPQGQKILIKNSLPKEIKEQTVLHEVLHAVLWGLGEYELEENEKLVQSLATSLYQLSKENDFISFSF